MTSVQVYATVHNTPMPYILLYNICIHLLCLYPSTLSISIYFVCIYYLLCLYPPTLSVYAQFVSIHLLCLYPPTLSLSSYFVSILLLCLYPSTLSLSTYFGSIHLLCLYPPTLSLSTYFVSIPDVPKHLRKVAGNSSSVMRGEATNFCSSSSSSGYTSWVQDITIYWTDRRQIRLLPLVPACTLFW